MRISVELSFYPLREDFKPPVTDVIEKLKTFQGLEIYPNRMSTQIFGDFKPVTSALNQTMEWAFEQFGHTVFVAKIMHGDRSPKTT